jgi:electron transfer flavoprotein alpha subunit
MDISDLSALLGEDLSTPSAADVWVLLPATGASLSPSHLGLIGEARRLADGLGCYVHVVLAHTSHASGTALYAAAIAAGANRVHLTADPAATIAAEQPEFVLLSAEHNALAARLAQHFKAGLITDVIGPLAIDGDTRALLGSHAVYAGDYFLDLSVTSAVKLATLAAAGLHPPSPDSQRSGEVITSDLPPAPETHRDLGPAAYHPPVWRPLVKARRIVAAGRGLHDAEGFALAQQLARLLGAELAGDRSARDLGWIDAAHEIGVTGQEVAPDLYLAVGIAGDTIHNAAITGARQVLAIHPNPTAPIFKAADLGLVADPKEALLAVLATIDKLA